MKKHNIKAEDRYKLVFLIQGGNLLKNPILEKFQNTKCSLEEYKIDEEEFEFQVILLKDFKRQDLTKYKNIVFCLKSPNSSGDVNMTINAIQKKLTSNWSEVIRILSEDETLEEVTENFGFVEKCIMSIQEFKDEICLNVLESKETA